VKERLKSTSSIEYVPYDKAYEPGFEDMMRRVPSVEKLVALTGFRPQTPLTEIIDRVTLSFQPKPERAPEVPVKTNAARQSSPQLS
jgi:UDP-glucose 4-epimerase